MNAIAADSRTQSASKPKRSSVVEGLVTGLPLSLCLWAAIIWTLLRLA